MAVPSKMPKPSDIIHIEIGGEARPFRKKTMSWQAKDGRSGTHAYDESSYAGWKDHARLAASKAMTDTSTGEVRLPIDKAMAVRIEAYFAIPESVSRKLRLKMTDGSVRPCKTPDADNIAKAVNDSLTGIAIRDDKYIVSLTVLKWYSDRPRVSVDIEVIPEMTDIAASPKEQPQLFGGHD